MRQLFRKRIGQSGHELVPAISFSFILHVIFFFAAFFLAARASQKTFIPPAYQVTLVGPVADIPAVPAGAVPAAPEADKKPEAKKAKPVRPDKKSGMPELKTRRPSPEKEMPELSEGETATQAKGVAVSSPQDFKFAPYLVIIRDKIERNWNPPPGAKEIKSRVVFKIFRTGRMGDAGLSESSGNFYFDQAAMRAVMVSSPFPPLPEGFFKEFEVFSVDLMEKE